MTTDLFSIRRELSNWKLEINLGITKAYYPSVFQFYRYLGIRVRPSNTDASFYEWQGTNIILLDKKEAYSIAYATLAYYRKL